MANLLPSHGGILIPLDVFRPTMLAAVLAEALVSKARNILDAKLTLTRHPGVQLVLGRIVGTVVGDDAASFWRENADLALAASQVVPRQLFLYYADPGPGPDRREGFVVAQRGQVLAADDADASNQPQGEARWPVTELAQRMQISLSELASGFAGGPTVELSLVEPSGDDRALLMELAGQPAGTDAGQGPEPPASGEAAAPPKPSELEQDTKRRAAEQHAEQVEHDRRAVEVASGLKLAIDELGVVVAPSAGLEEPEILEPFVVAELHGDVPSGLSSSLTDELQGKRIDIAVRVEFLSEVFVDNKPLSRSMFEERSREATLGGRSIQAMEVLAPRLARGTLFVADSARVFVSRQPGTTVPEELVLELLGPK